MARKPDKTSTPEKKLDVSKKLSIHRAAIAANPDAYTAYRNRLTANCRKHLVAMGFRGMDFRDKACKAAGDKYVTLIFRTQGNRPFFHVRIRGQAPFCWNAPKYWSDKDDYIHYEWGHINPRSETDVHSPKDLCIQSARCNQHVQAALPVADVRRWLHGSAIATRIDQVMAAREKLFKTKAWTDLMEEFETYRKRRRKTVIRPNTRLRSPA